MLCAVKKYIVKCGGIRIPKLEKERKRFERMIRRAGRMMRLREDIENKIWYIKTQIYWKKRRREFRKFCKDPNNSIEEKAKLAEKLNKEWSDFLNETFIIESGVEDVIYY